MPELQGFPSVRLPQQPYINVQDQKAQNTDGGTFNSGAWQTRTLNTIQADTHSLIRLVSNQIYLPPGSYYCIARAPGMSCGWHQIRLQDIGRGVTLLLGTNAYSNSTASYAQTDSWINGWFQISSDARCEIQHQCSNTRPNDGWGIKTNWGVEVYTVAQFWREQ